VRRYATMLRAGKKAPAISIFKLPRGGPFRYHISDGAHRISAAKREGRTTIDAFIVTAR
jgi:hypothetical protein